MNLKTGGDGGFVLPVLKRSLCALLGFILLVITPLVIGQCSRRHTATLCFSHTARCPRVVYPDMGLRQQYPTYPGWGPTRQEANVG